jgi:hypothetical protein
MCKPYSILRARMKPAAREKADQETKSSREQGFVVCGMCKSSEVNVVNNGPKFKRIMEESSALTYKLTMNHNHHQMN